MPTSTIESSGLVISRTWLNQTRIAAYQNGVGGFLVSTSVSQPGLLPDCAVFRMTIVDPNDPSRDAFYSVVRAVDFSAYTSDRAAAVASGSSSYRASSLNTFYSDITVAKLAATNLQNEVDKLVQDWIVYSYDFSFGPPGDFTYLPSTDKAILEALVANWQSAHTATVTAASELDSAKKAAAAAATDLARAQTAFDNVTALKNIIDSMKAQSDALGNVLDFLQQACTRLGDEPVPIPNANADVGSGLWKRLNNLLRAINTGSPSAIIRSEADNFIYNGIPDLETVQQLVCGQALVAADAAYTDESVAVSQAEGTVNVARQAQLDANAAYLAAVTALSVANATYTAASGAESQALTRVRAACSQFDPNDPTAVLG